MRKRTLLCAACCAVSIALACLTAVFSPAPIYAEAAIGDAGQAESDDIELYGEPAAITVSWKKGYGSPLPGIG